MSSQFTQGPGRPTRNSQQAGIASALLFFGRRRASPPRNVLGLEVDTAITEVPTVVRTPATPVHPSHPITRSALQSKMSMSFPPRLLNRCFNRRLATLSIYPRNMLGNPRNPQLPTKVPTFVIKAN